MTASIAAPAAMTGAALHWALALPELALACCALAILLVGVLRSGEGQFLCAMLSVAALLGAGALVAQAPYGAGYGGLFANDAFSAFAKMLILAGSILSLVLSLDYNRREGLRGFEFPVLVLLATVGMMVMVSAANLASLYVGLELQSLSLYVLASFARDELRSSEAGLKYFILGSLASGLLLYGISLVYGFSGGMAFGHIARALAGGFSPGLVVGIVFVVAGLAFKISAAPFHMWTPDVYEGAPTPVTALMSTAPKVAAVAMLLRVMAVPFGPALEQWRQVIILVSVASMLVGSLGAIGQWNIKRLMAYSSIGHMGYALIGLAAGTRVGLQGVLVYMATYLFMSAGGFACLVAMRRNGQAVEKIEDLAGLGQRDPLLALLMGVVMFSMAGIPPLSGFFGKLYVFQAAVQSGLWALAVIGVLTSVIGAFYYLRVVKVMYFDEAREGFDPRAPSVSLVGAAGGLFTGLFFLFPAPVVGAAGAAARALLG